MAYSSQMARRQTKNKTNIKRISGIPTEDPTDQGEYDSRKKLSKLIKTALAETSWRLMSEGISYRLGVLTGRIRVYEGEEDLLKLVENLR